MTKYDVQLIELQNKYANPNLFPICGGGQIKNPKLFLIFMNATAKNVSANKHWEGIRAPWIGTKNVWNMLSQASLFNNELNNTIQKRKAVDWDNELAIQTYQELKKEGLYITEFAKNTQDDARPLSNKIFNEYLHILLDEISYVKPKKIIAFGNQVSSLLLNKKISMKESFYKNETLQVNGHNYPVYPSYYPVGQGMRNLPLVISFLKQFAD